MKAEPSQAAQASLDIIETKIIKKGGTATFSTRSRRSRQAQSDATCEFEGSSVYAYVWPTSLDSSNVDFYQKQGIVALAVILHPDFDDAANSGRNWHKWHPHWVVPQSTRRNH